MEIGVKNEGRCLEIYLKGELDHHSVKGLLTRLEREIEIALPRQLILDMSSVAFMDSSGIAVVMRSCQRMKALGGSLKLRKIGMQPRKVLDAAGISRLIEIE